MFKQLLHKLGRINKNHCAICLRVPSPSHDLPTSKLDSFPDVLSVTNCQNNNTLFCPRTFVPSIAVAIERLKAGVGGTPLALAADSSKTVFLAVLIANLRCRKHPTFMCFSPVIDCICFEWRKLAYSFLFFATAGPFLLLLLQASLSSAFIELGGCSWEFLLIFFLFLFSFLVE